MVLINILLIFISCSFICCDVLSYSALSHQLLEKRSILLSRAQETDIFLLSLFCDLAGARNRSQISVIFIYLWSLLSMYLRYMICTKTLTNPRENQRALLKMGVPGEPMSFSMLEVFSVLRIRPVLPQGLIWGLCTTW